MNIFVVGGGNIAHSIAAKLSQTMVVTVLTRRPLEWKSRLEFIQGDAVSASRFTVAATSEVDGLSEADIVFVALPQFAIEAVIDRIEARLKKGSTIVFVPAPARIKRYAESFARHGIRTVGFQRVPYIARILRYGQSVTVSGDRETHKIVVSDPLMRAEWHERCSLWFGGTAEYLSSFLALAFNNSNPLLHPSRLVVLFKNWRQKKYLYNPPFYGEWTDESSELYVNADGEMREVMTRYPLDMESDYESVSDHYGVMTIGELTGKLHSIPSFKSILSPMVQTADGWIPDFNSRYFTEDIRFGLAEMLKLAQAAQVSVPTMRALYDGVNKLR